MRIRIQRTTRFGEREITNIAEVRAPSSEEARLACPILIACVRKLTQPPAPDPVKKDDASQPGRPEGSSEVP